MKLSDAMEKQGKEEANSPPRLRVCMLSFYFFPDYSGSAIQAKNLSRYLANYNVEAFIVSANLSKSARRDKIEGIPLYRIPVVNTGLLLLPSFWLSLAIFLVVKRKDYDVIHAHGTVLHAIASLIGRMLGKKTLLKIAMANSDIAFHKQGRLMGRVIRYLVEKFDHYIATSKDIYGEFREFGIQSSDVTLLPNGVDTHAFMPVGSGRKKSELRSKLGIQEGFVICFVGIVIARKNVDLILRVWQKLMSMGVNGSVVLVGPIPKDNDGRESEYVRNLRDYTARNGLVDSVIFADRQERISDYMQASDLFFFPSKQEGMPNVLLEAMACGLPCVVSRISGTADLVEDGRTGFIVSMDDEQTYVKVIYDLSRDRSLATTIGTNACESIKQRFSLNATAKNYRMIYSRLLGLNCSENNLFF